MPLLHFTMLVALAAIGMGVYTTIDTGNGWAGLMAVGLVIFVGCGMWAKFARRR